MYPDDLAAIGLPRPRSFAYPYGEHDKRVREAVRAAGFAMAFTVAAGRARSGTDPLAIPRFEVLGRDSPLRLVFRIVVQGSRGSDIIRAARLRLIAAVRRGSRLGVGCGSNDGT